MRGGSAAPKTLLHRQNASVAHGIKEVMMGVSL
jgi:hypothetical protein